MGGLAWSIESPKLALLLHIASVKEDCRRFWEAKVLGDVVRVGQQLGPKNVHTDEPTEKVDTKILETLVELDAGTYLPDGPRVDAFILPDPGEVVENR